MASIHDVIKKARSGMDSHQAELMGKAKENFGKVWDCVFHWACANVKKKMTIKTKRRLQHLNEIKEDLYSSILPHSGAEMLHCLELCALAVGVADDEEYVTKASGFTTAETCAMVADMHDGTEDAMVGTAKYCTGNMRLLDFLSSNDIEKSDAPSIPDLLMECVSDQAKTSTDITDIDLNNQFSEVFSEKYNMLKEGMGANIAFNNDRAMHTIEDMAFTMVINSLLGFVCKVCALPVIQDGLVMDELVASTFKCQDKFKSRKAADAYVESAMDEDDPTTVCISVIGLMATEFAANNLVNMWRMGRNMPDKKTLAKVYNDSGVMVHDSEESRMFNADWCEFSVSFYNAIAEHYVDSEGVHDDVAESLEAALAAKDNPVDVDKAIAGATADKSSYKHLFQNLPGVAMTAGKEDADEDDIVESKPKKKRRPKKL